LAVYVIIIITTTNHFNSLLIRAQKYLSRKVHPNEESAALPSVAGADKSSLYVTLKNGRGVFHKLEEGASKLN